jgi:hypothetical protein
VSHPDGLPDLFLDRSLGRVRVPSLLRAAGLRLVTLSERYGVPADERIPDHWWLGEAGARGEAVFMKDARHLVAMGLHHGLAENGEVIPAHLVVAEVAEVGQDFGRADEIGEEDTGCPAGLRRPHKASVSPPWPACPRGF